MTYYDQATLSRDTDFTDRIAACFATQGIRSPLPLQWAQEHQWAIAAAPGFAAAYAYAVAHGTKHPGRDASVITDEDLLAAVQAEVTAWKAGV